MRCCCLTPTAAAPSGSGENKGPAIARFLLNELADLEPCLGDDGTVDEYKLTEVLRSHGRLAVMPEEVAARSVRTEEMLQAIKTFAVACANPASTIGEVISRNEDF